MKLYDQVLLTREELKRVKDKNTKLLDRGQIVHLENLNESSVFKVIKILPYNLKLDDGVLSFYISKEGAVKL